MFELIYTSAARRPFSSDELVALLAKARRNNAALGVTGMLLYDRGSFLQVLEGEAPAVRTLYEHIAKDPRHQRAIVVLQSFVPKRSFADWTMGFVSIDRARSGKLSGFDEFLVGGVSTLNEPGGGRKAREILSAFGSGRWRTCVEA